MVCLQELKHTIPFLQLSCTKSHHYCATFCEALLFFLCIQKNQPTCWLMSSQHNMSHHLAWSRQQNFMKFWADIPKIFPKCWECQPDMSFWGVSQHNTMPKFPIKAVTCQPGSQTKQQTQLFHMYCKSAYLGCNQ